MRPLQTDPLRLPFDPTRFVVEGLWRRYGLALALFGAAILPRLALDRLAPGQVQFLTFFPAEIVTAFLCGPLPAVMVLTLSGITGGFLLPPAPIRSEEVWGFVLFMLDGGMDIVFIYFMMGALRRLKARDEQLLMINSELKHRIINIFAIARSICSQTIREGVSIADINQAVNGRIAALATAQGRLSIRATEGVPLHDLIETLVAPVSPAPGRLKTSGPPIMLPETATTPFALILHELATNALKYGAWASDQGVVAIVWSVHAEKEGARELDFAWRERGGPPSSTPTRSGLGSRLIKGSLGNAQVDHTLGADGLDCRIRLPM